MKVFELQELEEATNGFSPSRLIGKGSHGSVYKGVLNDGQTVAVKRQSFGLQKLQDNTKLWNEARIFSSLCPNSCLVGLLGIGHDAAGNKNLVTEYMPNGTLEQMLHSSSTGGPTWLKRVEIALQIARGIRFLHEETGPAIVHRDIKPANILFGESWTAKLADFGLAVILNSDHNNELNRLLPAGTIGYIDPSYTTPRELSTKIDVYSYGVVLLELLSGRKVIDVGKSPASIVEWALPLIWEDRTMEVCDARVHMPRYMSGMVKEMLGLAARCVSVKESARPSMGEIVAYLEDLTVEPIRVRWSVDCFRDIFLSMIGRKKFKLGGTKCSAVTASESGSSVGSSNICKGTMLVREILADIRLK